jgi:hypothetical protein
MASMPMAASRDNGDGHMAVGVQCDADLRMTEDLHDHSSGHTLREHERRRGVPQIV